MTAEVLRLDRACMERARLLRHRARELRALGCGVTAHQLNADARQFDAKGIRIGMRMTGIRETDQWSEW
jgi:hypothetical protein